MRGLDVAVHDAECVERSEAGRRLREQRPRLRLRQPLTCDAPFLERMAADIFLDNDRLVFVFCAEEDFRPERRRHSLMLAQQRKRHPARMHDAHDRRPPRIIRHEPDLAAHFCPIQPPHLFILARKIRLRRIQHRDRLPSSFPAIIISYFRNPLGLFVFRQLLCEIRPEYACLKQ